MPSFWYYLKNFSQKITVIPLLSGPCILVHSGMRVIFLDDITVTFWNAADPPGAGVLVRHILKPQDKHKNVPAAQNPLHFQVAHHSGMHGETRNICFMSH